MTPAEVIADAALWRGTPFVHQARRRGVGSDCIGLVGGIARDRGTPEGLAWAADPAMRAYGRIPSPRTLLAGVERYLDPIAASEARVGDIVLMRFADDPQHFALLSRDDPPYIIHASISAGAVVEHRLDDLWRSRIVRAYRYRGLE